ncbi:hypothetical protein HAHE_09180 [Haloferula helveola]|uniref:Uncharacterized protein n=1 Tax=Haloferula helveola TaxID=490095 RepID=A0ABM7RCC6_9BACT|nr:hypothetical protein HAHE_09180 [Haloferula helveola]
MNENDIDRLLREQSPEVPVRPGLETRIRASLRNVEQRRRLPLVSILVPAALAIAIVVALLPEKPAEEVVDTPAPSELIEPVTEFAIEEPLPVNTLGNEARALRNDAERTGRFLLDCLPSITQATP